MMWYRSHRFDCLSGCTAQCSSPLWEPASSILGTKDVRRKWGSTGVLAQASPGALQGTRSPAGMKAGGWLAPGLPRQGGVCWVLPGEAHGRFQCSLALSVTFCYLCLEGVCILSVNQINVCILQPCGCCILVCCIWVVFGSCFNKDYWGPSLSVGKVESCLKLQSCFPPHRSSQLYFPALFCLCPGRSTPTCTDISLSLIFPLHNPHLFCIT